MLGGGGVLFVVEVVEQGGGGVERYQTLAVGTRQAETVGFGFTVGGDASLYSEGVFTQAFALGPLVEQAQSLLAAVCASVIRASGHRFPLLTILVRY